MKPPKIDICIEGYDTNQTDFYIGNLIEQHEADTKRISELQKENERLHRELELMSESMKKIASSSEKADTRLSAIEEKLGIPQDKAPTAKNDDAAVKRAQEAFAAEQAEISERLGLIRGNIGSLKAILNK